MIRIFFIGGIQSVIVLLSVGRPRITIFIPESCQKADRVTIIPGLYRSETLTSVTLIKIQFENIQ